MYLQQRSIGEHLSSLATRSIAAPFAFLHLSLSRRDIRLPFFLFIVIVIIIITIIVITTTFSIFRAVRYLQVAILS